MARPAGRALPGAASGTVDLPVGFADGRFARRVVDWQRVHGRHGLPWQQSRDPYRVWLSEIMLQQTQVATVLPYYDRWLRRFPDLAALAAADLADVMPFWAGLGYYARARNLHACARQVVAAHGGRFPQAAAALAELPGVGPSTAAAIAAFCFGERAAILDGNVKRVLARCLGVDLPAGPALHRALLPVADRLLPAETAEMPAYTQGLMDLGAIVCTPRAPACLSCPLAASCVARVQGRQAQLPAPRVRRATPVREAHLLVALAAGAAFVQRRPPEGLWGGLLALPQFETVSALQAAVPRAGRSAEPWPPRRHAFTHFTLAFTPHLMRLPRRRVLLAGGTWLPLDEVTGAALPAPLKRLLLDVARHEAGPLAPAGRAARR